MKRLIPTLVLVIVCIAAFWYASSKNFFQEQPETGTKLVTISKEDVSGYTIKTPDGEIELQKGDGGWQMIKPSALPLNNYSPDSWVDSFTGLMKESTVEAEPSDLAQFGLDQPTQEFTVKLKDGSSQTLAVGAAVPIQGYRYARYSGSPEVFQISDSAVTSLAKQPFDFMETSPLQMKYDQVQSLSVAWKGAKWTLSRNEADKDKKAYEAAWKLGDKEVKGADAGNFLDNALFMSTNRLVEPAAQIQGLDQPELVIELKELENGQEKSAVYAGKIKGSDVWIARQGGEWAYAIPVDRVQELFDKAKDWEQKQQEAQQAQEQQEQAQQAQEQQGLDQEQREQDQSADDQAESASPDSAEDSAN